MSDVKKEYINADDKYVAANIITLAADETVTDLTKDEMIDAFVKRCIIVDADGVYNTPASLTVAETYASITFGSTTIYSAEYEG